MSRLQVGGLALVVKDQDERNIGNVVSLYAHYDEYMGDKDVWLFDCNDGMYVNRALKYTCIGAESCDLSPLGDKQTQDELEKEKELENG